MGSNKNKDPIDNLIDKVRTFFGAGNPSSDRTSSPLKNRFSIWYFVIVMIAFSYFQQFFFSAKVDTISYGQFKQYIAEGELSELTISPDSIQGTIKGSPAKKFTTVRVNDPNLVKELDERRVTYSGRLDSKFLGALLCLGHPYCRLFSDLAIRHEKNGFGNGRDVFWQKQSQNFCRKRYKGHISMMRPASTMPKKSFRRWSNS